MPTTDRDALIEHPIIFNGEMVRAILGGRKTQTGRVIKLPEHDLLGGEYRLEWDDDADCGDGTYRGCLLWHCDQKGGDPEVLGCPFGYPGDRLWVRETFSLPLLEPCYRGERDCPQVVYAADGHTDWPTRNRPSIHMPRWASRIDLEITDVRVERVQEISLDDCVAEGVIDPRCAGRSTANFAALWDSINAKRGFGWEANPWVWVIEFRKEKP